MKKYKFVGGLVRGNCLDIASEVATFYQKKENIKAFKKWKKERDKKNMTLLSTGK